MLQDAKHLDKNEKNALVEIKKRISSKFPRSSYVLFGSKARGDFLQYSDIDLLVLSEENLTWQDIGMIISEVYEVNLVFGTLFTSHVVTKDDWEKANWKCLPLKESVEKDGIAV